ncbi:MAG: type II toxin-antitoxin system HicA family toxin [Verrucomicrobia bacterium]|nr:type II toxin-antitoxin system HicA family toxin [Verrucomicrobiota bacterium]
MRLSPVSRRELIRRLRSLGWDGPISGGNHQFMTKGATQLTLPNPHKNKEIGPELLRLILREASISRAEWLRSG